VYVGSLDKKVYALNGKTGAKLWEFATGGELRTPIAIGSDGTVYVGSEDKKVYALNGKTGAKL
jgi:outer membrane protein assembly factor BamB